MPAIGVHHTETDGGRWDGPANEARARSGESMVYYRRIYAWRDPDGDETVKASYKFIHHTVSGDGEPGAANVRACQTGIGVLNGARGGADIPEADRRGVYNHLAAHLRDADVEPADLRMERGAAEMERRSLPAQELRLLEADEDQGPRIVGYAAVFNTVSAPLGSFRETIQPGAFARTIQESDVRALWNHDRNLVLGRTKNGTLRLVEDQRGLRYEIDPPDTSWARDALASIGRGDVSESSFGFDAVEDRWETRDDGLLRTLIDVELYDISPVTFPAYASTTAEVRAQAEEMNQQASTGAEPGGGPAAGGAGDPDTQVRLDLMRRRLELEEAG